MYLALFFFISACSPSAPTIPTSTYREIINTNIESSKCSNVSGIWLGQVTDDLEGVEFANPWGLVLEQQDCNIVGKLALNLDGPDIVCENEGNSLKCQFFAGPDCSNQVLLDYKDNQLSGKLISCFSTESDVLLKKKQRARTQGA